MATTNFDAVAAASGFTGDLTGNVTGDIAGDVLGNTTGLSLGPVSTYTADGAIALTDKVALLDGSSATAQMTLAKGTAGQEIIVIAVDVSNACDVDPASFANGTTVTFTPAFEWARFVSDGTNWYMIGGTGAVT